MYLLKKISQAADLLIPVALVLAMLSIPAYLLLILRFKGLT